MKTETLSTKNLSSIKHNILSADITQEEIFKQKSELKKIISSNKNLKISKKLYNLQTEMIKGIIVHFCDIEGSGNFTPARFGGPHNHIQIAQAVVKSLINIDAVILLISNGHFGAAKAICRQIFEFCILSKFCAIHPTQSKYDKWLLEENLSVGKEILSQLNTPYLKRFWSDLSTFNHARKTSGQAVLGQLHEDYSIELQSSINILITTQALLFHLINTVAMKPKLKYFIFRYSFEDRKETYNSSRDEIKILLKRFKTNNSTETIKGIIKDYESDWKYRLIQPNSQIKKLINNELQNKYSKSAEEFFFEIFRNSLFDNSHPDAADILVKTSRDTESWIVYLLKTGMFEIETDEETRDLFISIKDEYSDCEESGVSGWSVENDRFEKSYQRGFKLVDHKWIKDKTIGWN
jgi:hypothetical protein